MMRFAFSWDKFSSLWWVCLKSKVFKYIYIYEFEMWRFGDGFRLRPLLKEWSYGK